jgi:hypothetical protein
LVGGAALSIAITSDGVKHDPTESCAVCACGEEQNATIEPSLTILIDKDYGSQPSFQLRNSLKGERINEEVGITHVVLNSVIVQW